MSFLSPGSQHATDNLKALRAIRSWHAMSEWEGGGDESWLARASSLPGRVSIAPSFLSADLSRFRSFLRSDGPDDLDEDVDDYPRAWRSHHVTPTQYGAAPIYSPVPAPDDADAVTRLEVLKAPEVNFAVLSVYVSAFVAFIYVVFVTRATRISWAKSAALPGGYWPLVSSLIRSVLNGVFFALPIVFILRLAMADKVCSEQLWTAALLSAGLFGANPLTDWVYSLRSLGDYMPTDSAFISRAPESHHAAHLVIYDAVYSVIIYMYLLLSIHSYRVLDPKNYSRRSFYLPKLVAACSYFCVKLVLGFGFRVALGLVPFVRLLGWIFLEMSGRHSVRLTIPVLVTTLADALLCLWIIKEVSQTARFLAEVPYLETRSKQLGFRCCVYQSLIYGMSSLLIAAFLICSIPREVLYLSYDWSVGPTTMRYLQLEPPVGQIALAIVYVTWNLVLAYVNLPPGPLVPYTMEGVQNLSRLLPRALTARHRWPVWMPGSIPCEPDEEEVHPLTVELPAGDDRVDDRSAETLEYLSNNGDALRRGSLGIENMATVSESPRSHRDRRQSALVPLSYWHREWHERRRRASAHDNLESFMLPAAFSGSSRPFLRQNRYWSDCNIRTAGIESVSMDTVVPALHSRRTSDLDGAFEDDESMTDLSREISPSSSGMQRTEGTSEQTRLLSLSGEANTFCNVVGDDFPQNSPTVYQSRAPGRLITRKNLFVMETQVILASAAYLCYIPGNREEEMPMELKALHPSSRFKSEAVSRDGGSFAAGLDELAAQMEMERRSSVQAKEDRLERERECGRKRSGRDWSLEHDLGTGGDEVVQMPSVQSLPDVQAAGRRPEYDDGTSFLVDPEDMASHHGFYFYRHIRHDESNGHAIVLVGKDRVVVAFSGTRDAKNWVTNSKFARTPWDEIFGQFEYEPSDGDGQEESSDIGKQNRGSIPGNNERPEVGRGNNSDRRSNSMRNHASAQILVDPVETTDVGEPYNSKRFKAIEQREGSTAHNVEDPLAREDNTCRQSHSFHSAKSLPERDRHSNHSGKKRERAENRRLLTRSRSEEGLRYMEIELARSRNKRPSSNKTKEGNEEVENKNAAGDDHRSSIRPRNIMPYLPLYRNRGGGSNRIHESLRQRIMQTRSRLSGRRNELENMAVILASELATYGHAKVHRGFAIAYGKVRKRVMGALVELYGGRQRVRNERERAQLTRGPKFHKDENGKVIGVVAGSCWGLPLFFAGHSMGGSLATFASYEAARYYQEIGIRRRQDVACTTFGAPMSLNSVFKTRYERLVETHWRFEFAADPIPKMPGGILNYVHVGVQVLIDQSGMMLIDPSLVEVQWWGRLGNPYLGYRLHLRASYLAALRVFCARYKNGEDPMLDQFWEFPIKMQTRGLFPSLETTGDGRGCENV